MIIFIDKIVNTKKMPRTTEQFELMRIKRDMKLKNSINDIERLKFNLNNNNNINTNFIKTK